MAHAASPNPRRLALLAAVAALMAGCAKPPPPPPPPPLPTRIDATLHATPQANPDSSGRPSPIVVRVFELKSPAAFQAADFFSLWDKEAATLGADVVARDEFVLRPGQSLKIERKAQDATRLVGVLAAYRDLDRAVWRVTSPILPNRTHTLDIAVGERQIVLR